MLQRKLALGGVPRICLPKDGVAVAGDNFPSFQGRPDVLLDCIIRRIFANRLLHLAEPDQHFLVSKPVERSSEAVEGCTVCQEGI